MLTLAQLTPTDFEHMEREILQINEGNSEEALCTVIGNALHDSGLTVAEDDSFKLVVPKVYNEATTPFSLKSSFDFTANTQPNNQAQQEGRKFWRRFRNKLRHTICNEPTIQALMDQGGDLRDYLAIIIPIIMGALGLTVLNPLALGLIAAVLAMLIKSGFHAFCENES